MYIKSRNYMNLRIRINIMEYIVNFLSCVCGSHERAAELLGYSERHYRKIRKRIRKGEHIPARIENLLKAKMRELQLAGATDAGR